MAEKYIELLPDSFSKAKDTNTEKLLDLNEYALRAYRTYMQTVSKNTFIQTATGSSLDLYGEMLGFGRSGRSDDLYRCILIALISGRNNKGTHDYIRTAISEILTITPDKVEINEQENCVVEIHLPSAVISALGFAYGDLTKIITDLLPAGVDLILYTNTDYPFTFGEDEYDYDPALGFADLEQTYGGTLGSVYE